MHTIHLRSKWPVLWIRLFHSPKGPLVVHSYLKDLHSCMTAQRVTLTNFTWVHSAGYTLASCPELTAKAALPNRTTLNEDSWSVLFVH